MLSDVFGELVEPNPTKDFCIGSISRGKRKNALK
jgi:hypothetical protein